MGFCEFAESCNKHGIKLVHHGQRTVGRDTCKNAWFTDMAGENSKTLTNEERDDLVRTSLFAPAFQGETHIADGKIAYIPDRALSSAATGQLVATNNKAVKALFEGHDKTIVYGEAGDLCGMAAKLVRE